MVDMLHVYNPTTSHSSSSSSSSSSLPFSALAPMLIKSEGMIREQRQEFSRTSSYTNADANSDSYQQRRPRRVASEVSLFTLSAGGRRSSSQDASRDDSDTYVTSQLCFNMWRYLGVGYRWIIRFLALGCYAFLLFPGFVQVAFITSTLVEYVEV